MISATGYGPVVRVRQHRGGRGLQVIIAAAGGPTWPVTAAKTRAGLGVPWVAIPAASTRCSRPCRCRPASVGTLAIGKPGAINAAFLPDDARQQGAKHAKRSEYRAKQTQAVVEGDLGGVTLTHVDQFWALCAKIPAPNVTEDVRR